MGHKVNPISLRLLHNRNIDSAWYSDFNYANLAAYEFTMRLFFKSIYSSAKIFPARIISNIFPKRHIIYNISYVPQDVKRKQKIKSLSKTITSKFSFNKKEANFLALNNDSVYSRVLLIHLAEAEKRGLNIDNLLDYSTSIFVPDFPINKVKNNKEDITNINNLTNQYTFAPLQKHIENYVSNQSGLNTQLFGIKTNNVYQSANTVASLIVSGLEHKKSLRQIWGNLLEELITGTTNKHNIKGIRILCAGRIGGAEMARMESRKWGSTPLHTFSEKIDYAGTSAHTVYGRIGVKVWICYK